VPAAGDQPTVDAETRGIRIDVEGLRIVLPGEGDDLILREGRTADIQDIALVEVLEVAGQRRPARSNWSR
jgi:hypothetical protein